MYSAQSQRLEQQLAKWLEIGPVTETPWRNGYKFAAVFEQHQHNGQKPGVQVRGLNADFAQRQPDIGVAADLFVRWIEDCAIKALHRRKHLLGKTAGAILDEISAEQARLEEDAFPGALIAALLEGGAQVLNHRRVDLVNSRRYPLRFRRSLADFSYKRRSQRTDPCARIKQG